MTITLNGVINLPSVVTSPVLFSRFDFGIVKCNKPVVL